MILMAGWYILSNSSSGFFAMFTTVAVVLRINSIEISSPGWSRNFWGVPWFCCQVNADILSGIFLIADRPVRIGDRVKIEQTGRHLEEWGDVVDIALPRNRSQD
jgi:hypothetical protein